MADAEHGLFDMVVVKDISLCQKYCRPSAECPQTESIRNRDTVFDGQHDQHGKQ